MSLFRERLGSQWERCASPMNECTVGVSSTSNLPIKGRRKHDKHVDHKAHSRAKHSHKLNLVVNFGI